MLVPADVVSARGLKSVCGIRCGIPSTSLSNSATGTASHEIFGAASGNILVVIVNNVYVTGVGQVGYARDSGL
jgi:hypothetical protein